MERESKKKLPAVARRIFGEGSELGVRYVSSPSEVAAQDGSGAERAEPCLRSAFAAALASEVRARRTLVGPQRDDLEIVLGGRQAAAYASAGEQRRAAFSLVMAALELALESGSGTTIVLVDDIEAEFDDERLDHIFDFLARGNIQALVATSKVSVARRYAALGQVLRVEHGAFRAD